MEISVNNFSAVTVFIPDKPTEHTYRAMGYDDVKSQRKARLQGNNLRNNTQRSIELVGQTSGVAVPKILNWAEDIEAREEYQSELAKQKTLYETNDAFKDVVRSETEQVIKDRFKEGTAISSGVDIGIQYVLEELAWLTASPTILGVEDIAYVYHNQWFLDEFIAGRFDQREKNNLGFVVVR